MKESEQSNACRIKKAAADKRPNERTTQKGGCFSCREIIGDIRHKSCVKPASVVIRQTRHKGIKPVPIIEILTEVHPEHVTDAHVHA